MKHFLFLLGFVMSALATVARSAEAAPEITYTGEIAGIVCSSCKEHVTTMLMKKIDGIVSVDVKPSDKPDGNQKLVIVARNGKITKEAATEALGSFAKNYQIINLAKKG